MQGWCSMMQAVTEGIYGRIVEASLMTLSRASHRSSIIRFLWAQNGPGDNLLHTGKIIRYDMLRDGVVCRSGMSSELAGVRPRSHVDHMLNCSSAYADLILMWSVMTGRGQIWILVPASRTYFDICIS